LIDFGFGTAINTEFEPNLDKSRFQELAIECIIGTTGGIATPEN
jgi:hypothetical protein